MTAQLFLEEKDNLRQGAYLEDGKLYDYRKENHAPEAEQIYLCRIDRVVRGMDAAFVKLTPKENGFLPFTEIKGKISMPPRSGEKLLVQIKKPPVQNKCAYVTSDISLAGKYLILLPFSNRCSVSKRIEDEKLHQMLLEKGKEICPSKMGLIMREESAQADFQMLEEELAVLLQRWEKITELERNASAPSLLDSGLSLSEKMLREIKNPDCEIITNCPELTEGSPFPVHVCENPMDVGNIKGKLEKSLRRKIWLNSGGNLVFDSCEAMTVIDVNSAKDLGSKKGAADTLVRLNCEAAQEIARIIRLRKIGGIIIIDFADMPTDEDREKVISVFQDALSHDPVKTVIHGFTSLGLLEMTRKKTDSPMAVMDAPVCPYCHGTGVMETD